MKKFKQGDIVNGDGMFVLVTGEGNGVNYDSFAGVVLIVEDRYVSSFKIGWYSTTWNTLSFAKTKLKIDKIIKEYGKEQSNITRIRIPSRNNKDKWKKVKE